MTMRLQLSIANLVLLLIVLSSVNGQLLPCSELITDGVGNATVCQVRTGPENCSSECAANGTCFDQGFCCPRGFDLCGIGFATISACYDPNVFSCCGTFSSPGGTAPVLCPAVTDPNRERACIRAGFNRPGCAPVDPDQIPPPIPPNRCGLTTIDTEEYVCLSGLKICPRTAPLACNDDCFDPAKYTCTADYHFEDDSPLQFFQLCPIESPFLCGNHCYSKDRYVCYSHRLAGRETDMLCSLEAPLICGENQCYNDEFARCVDGVVEGF